MQNSDQNQTSLGIEDTSMTIEFLRARLLSERSVSKSARQRADELAERVAELEEQLRIMSLQRKKAEKVAADVLSILKTHGISDISDSFYSRSDQEVTPRGQKMRGRDSKKPEGSATSRERESTLEKFSGTELEPSPAPGRCLSWKGPRDSSRTIEKVKDSPIRRLSSFTSINSSTKHRLGKSFRQIKRREQRSEATELGDISSFKNKSQRNEDNSEIGAKTLRDDSGLQEEKASFEAVESSRLGDEFGAERDMERALEHQAQLIGQYKDMEKEQRQWEKKYRENNSSTVESCDPGNHSDITDEREEVKFQSPYSHQRVRTPPQDLKSEIKLPPTCNGLSGTHVPDGFPGTASQGDEKVHFQVQEGSTSLSLHDPMEQKSTSDGQGKQENPERNSASGPETSGKQIEPYSLAPHQTFDRVGYLLDTLQRAKLLLQEEISCVPSTGFGHAATDPSSLDQGPIGKVDIPGGCPGLIMLPTDFSLEAAKSNLQSLGSGSAMDSRLILMGYFPKNGDLLTSDDRFAGGRCTNCRPTSLPIDDRLLTNPFMNSASRAVHPCPGDPLLSSVIPATYTSYLQYPSYPNLVPRLPSNGVCFPRLDPNMASAVPPSDHFLFHRDMSGPKMIYRKALRFTLE